MFCRTSCIVVLLLVAVVVDQVSARAESSFGLIPIAVPSSEALSLDGQLDRAVDLTSTEWQFATRMENSGWEMQNPDLPKPISTAADWDYLWRATSAIPVVTIPEPTSLSLVGLGMLAAARFRRTGNQ